MSDNLSNGHSEPSPLRMPRVAPPEGQRTARGAYSPSSEEDDDTTFVDETSSVDDAEFVPEDTSNSVWDDDDSRFSLSKEASNADKLTVADVPTVEDSYEPPLGLATASGSGGGGSGLPPSDADGNGDSGSEYYKPNRREDTPKDVELGLMEHLNELRFRLLRCALILMAGMAVTWNYSKPLQEWFAAPIRHVLNENAVNGASTPNQMVSNDPMGFFSIAVQFSMVSALIITSPLLFWQVWRFIEPALTNKERRYSMVLVPFSTVLFFLGTGLGYAVSPLFYKFFIAFQPVGVAAMWDYSQSVILMAKMLLVFGVMFQVPIIIIFFNKIGILSRNVLIEYWRHAVVLIFLVVAILTPTWDPLTMTVCATPPCLLYVLSIWLIKWL